MAVGLKPIGKPLELLPTSIATAPRFYSTNNSYSQFKTRHLAPTATELGFALETLFVNLLKGFETILDAAIVSGILRLARSININFF